MKWVLVAVFISLLPVTSSRKLQISLPESVNVMEGDSVTLPCSFWPPPMKSNALLIKWVMMPTHYSERMPRWDIIEIYDSHSGNSRPGVAEFVGDEKSDCSFRIINVSKTLGPVFKCDVYCYRCGTEDCQVFGEVKLNVTAAALQLYSGASGTTVTGAGETSPTASPHFRDRMGLVAVVVVVVIVVTVTAVKFIQKRCRSSVSSPGSHSGDGQADVHGDVEANGHPLMVVNGHKEDNGNKGMDAFSKKSSVGSPMTTLAGTWSRSYPQCHAGVQC